MPAVLLGVLLQHEGQVGHFLGTLGYARSGLLAQSGHRSILLHLDCHRASWTKRFHAIRMLTCLFASRTPNTWPLSTTDTRRADSGQPELTTKALTTGAIGDFALDLGGADSGAPLRLPPPSAYYAPAGPGDDAVRDAVDGGPLGGNHPVALVGSPVPVNAAVPPPGTADAGMQLAYGMQSAQTQLPGGFTSTGSLEDGAPADMFLLPRLFQSELRLSDSVAVLLSVAAGSAV